MSSGSQQTVGRVRNTVASDTELFADAEPALHEMQEIVGRKWHPILLHYLLTNGSMSFSALKSNIDGISAKMLSKSLSLLEDTGLVTREVISDQPVRVEYSLTERGASLERLLSEMIMWGAKCEEV